ncbi:hypothetical protein BRADI_1g42315v3 [Brachypodium distachyon]|uniref:Uncharacterized protein n=1 Tax=Brachypodium distachyon TaxID=15368 RepID=A0A0Q3H675_BRADI|nr:hypothetical protein BRADI_1g42315v3 [Brachypodium distachyon]
MAALDPKQSCVQRLGGACVLDSCSEPRPAAGHQGEPAAISCPDCPTETKILFGSALTPAQGRWLKQT